MELEIPPIFLCRLAQIVETRREREHQEIAHFFRSKMTCFPFFSGGYNQVCLLIGSNLIKSRHCSFSIGAGNFADNKKQDASTARKSNLITK